MNQDNGEYSSQYKAYLNKQDIVDANEIVKLKISIPEKIRYGKLSYQTLLAIERFAALCLFAPCTRLQVTTNVDGANSTKPLL